MNGHGAGFFSIFKEMKSGKYILFALLALLSVRLSFAQIETDSSFSLLINNSFSYTHAQDIHINKWLSKYGYQTIPRVPCSYNFELSAIPSGSRLLYDIQLSTITDVRNLSTFNITAGLYDAIIKTPSFLFYGGANVGFHSEIITINGNIPPEYRQLADNHTSLALRRIGFAIDPGLKAMWLPIRIGNVQIGAYGGLSYALALNSGWKLGYYNNNHGKYSRFRPLGKPADQLKVSEHGFSVTMGLSIRIKVL